METSKKVRVLNSGVDWDAGRASGKKITKWKVSRWLAGRESRKENTERDAS